MNYADPQAHTMAVLDQVLDERARQDEKWGPPDPACPDGTGAQEVREGGRVVQSDHLLEIRRGRATEAQEACERAKQEGRITFRHILEEEVREAFAEDDPSRLRAELVQVAAVAAKWIEAIDRRTP